MKPSAALLREGRNAEHLAELRMAMALASFVQIAEARTHYATAKPVLERELLPASELAVDLRELGRKL